MNISDNERLRLQFAQKANGAGPWIEKAIESVTAVHTQMTGTLDSQLAKLKQHQTAVYQYQPNIDQMESVNQVGFLNNQGEFLMREEPNARKSCQPIRIHYP